MTNARAPSEVFSTRVAITLFLVGVFSFCAFITLSAFAPELMDGNDAKAHALSKSAIGYAGLVNLLQRRGHDIVVRRSAPTQREDGELVILTPDSKVTLNDLDRLGGEQVLIILPKWLAIPSATRKGWAGEARPNSPTWVEDILKDIAPKIEIKRSGSAESIRAEFNKPSKPAPFIKSGTVKDLQYLSGPGIAPVLKTQSGKVVLAEIETMSGSLIYILAEPDLANTQGLSDLETARLALEIIENYASNHERIVFDVTLNGFERSQSIIRAAFSPPLLALTLSLVIASALIAWRAATRDGPIEKSSRAIAFGKRTLADNSAAMIRLAGREHMMVRNYAAFMRSFAAARIGIAQDSDHSAAVELDRIAESRGLKERFATLAGEAALAVSPETALDAARKLHVWQEEIIRATR